MPLLLCWPNQHWREQKAQTQTKNISHWPQLSSAIHHLTPEGRKVASFTLVVWCQYDLVMTNETSRNNFIRYSVLWCCWLRSKKGIRHVKNWVVGRWHGYLSGARCRLAYSPADATATHCLLLQWNPDWFYLSGTGSPLRVIKCVCVFSVKREYDV